ncbi:uncharacterized protein C12orf50 homolog [Phalacrocorax carbo]|uniref:uncharacterized protein C12orf50 homolog n=1 Tax=Phalacrocorax carbo TaxID=9209 RepID=UPI00311989C6
MSTAGSDSYFQLCFPYTQQKNSNISCFWETQPLGCVRITCAFHHRKPRNINGLFLPPTDNAPLQQGVQEGILHPAHRQDALRSQENILRPIHPPLIINLNDKQDEEDDEEGEKDVAEWVPKTAADSEEERAIKEICYKSGEYYRIRYPHEHQSTKSMYSPRENELLPLEASERGLQKGDGTTSPTKFHNTRRGGESLGRRAPTEGVPRTYRRSFENGGIHTPDPKRKPRYQQRGQSEDDKAASSVPCARETGRKTYFNPSQPRRSAYVVYRTVTVTQEAKFNGCTAVPEPDGGKCSKQKNQPDTNRRCWTQTDNCDKYTSGPHNAPPWRKRNPQAKTFSTFKTTIQSQEDRQANRKGERYVDRRKR